MSESRTARRAACRSHRGRGAGRGPRRRRGGGPGSRRAGGNGGGGGGAEAGPPRRPRRPPRPANREFVSCARRHPCRHYHLWTPSKAQSTAVRKRARGGGEVNYTDNGIDMNRILVIGAAGMIGRKLLQKLAQGGSLGASRIAHATLHDVVAPQPPPGAPFQVRSVASDLSLEGEADKLVAERPGVIFHLAAVVSGEAEADFEKGYRVNLDGTRQLVEAIRRVGAGYKPRVVFTSSIAVFGAPFPGAIGDEFLSAPLTSYGTQKAMAELLLSDYTRRGFFDGIGIRLPTVCVRPGKPNLAASGFFSGIIREPLNGQEAVLPVSEDVRHWHASPRAAVGFLLHAAALAGEGERIGPRRNLTMPGLSVTVAEQIAALRRGARGGAGRRILREPDPALVPRVEGWRA